MRHRVYAAAGLLAAACLALTACGGGPSYQQKTDRCAKAIAAKAADDKTKPKACDGISDDDYTTLNVGHVIDKSGVVDDNGNVDLDKLLSPTATP